MFCSKCGQELLEGSKFCGSCGTPVNNDVVQDTGKLESIVEMVPVSEGFTDVNKIAQPQGTQDAKEGYTKKKKPVGLILGIVIGIVVLIVASIIGVFLWTSNSSAGIAAKAEKYAQRGDTEKAIEYYEELLDIDDTNEDAYIALAELYLDQDDAKAAEKILKRGTKKLKKTSEEFDELYASVQEMMNSREASQEAVNLEEESQTQGEVPMDDVPGKDTPVKENAAATTDRRIVNMSLISTDVSNYPVVRLYVDVTDYDGEQIALANPQGRVKEKVSGGAYVEREVKRIEKLEGNQGLSIELIADKSGSMDSRMAQVQEVMKQFVTSLDYEAGDQVELISFDSYIMYMCTKTQDVSLLTNGIDNMVATGGTALYDALYEGVINAGLQTGARCVIAFTDGEDNESVHSYQEIINMAQERSVTIYIIGTDRSAESTLQDIAFSTNGYYWYIDDLANMGDILEQIYVEQKDLYCLEYVSDTAIGQYQERTVDVNVSDDMVVTELATPFTPVQTLQKQDHDSRYEIIAADMSWTEANAECMKRGGHLATITSEQEAQQLIELAESSGLKYLWIGGYTSVNAYQAFGHWVTGEPFSYTMWYEGEPSRNDMDGTPEMYIMLWKLQGEWSWNDQRNDPAEELSYFIGNIGYICEYEN